MTATATDIASGVLLIVIVMVIVIVALWVAISRSCYSTTKIKPGMSYSVGNRQYTFPNIQLHGAAYKLEDSYIEQQRWLFRKTSEVLTDLGVEFWPTGGTLLGIQRQATIPAHYDDDIDIGVLLKHKKLLFSSEFTRACEARGLRTVYLVTNNENRADVHGGAVRLQPVHGVKTTLDIFFWQVSTDGKSISKLDGWDGDDTTYKNTTETFPVTALFPLKPSIVDKISVRLPQNPTVLLEQQYGNTAMEVAVMRPLLISHAFPFLFLQLCWLTRPA